MSLTSLEFGSLNWFPGLRDERVSEILCIVRACLSIWWSWGGLEFRTAALWWGGIWVLVWISGSLAIISKRVGLDRVILSGGGGGDIGLSNPAVSAELNLEKLEGNESWPLIEVAVEVKSMTGDRLPGENRILKEEEGESDPGDE